ncbi:unnamed protein product [Paramecium octaurelia]|uniref:Rad50/SbcC-type AAA domain-containing protein n=1 Tax=Paramecium octaurelia TaxID=43137 RepID=A0A8S1UB46_PAROT|nr:unnamed protein product [Paramecium octaurelia]
MSSLLHLKLDGIRSYCHVGQVKEDNRRAAQQSQSIYFKQPLTLIWGHNGSGKTTIIEALRTITTGMQPPNSEKGRSFLTDSHLLGQSKTDACIELSFKSINNREIVARRHFSIVYDSPNSCKFSSLRSTLQTRSLETDKLETLHSTCANIEKQIPCFLGVSVPILNNVLLCHQEEQLWMFSDNSTLKGIFDELFETTDLVSIEVRLREQLKEAESKAKVLMEKVEFSKRDMDDGQRQRTNLQNQLEEKVQEIKIIQDINSQMNQIQISNINFNIIQQRMSECADLIACRNSMQENKLQLQLDHIDLNQLSQQDFVISSLKQLEIELKSAQDTLKSTEINVENKKIELQELQVDTSIETLKQEVKLIRDSIRSLFMFSNNISDENLLKQVKEKISYNKLEQSSEQQTQQEMQSAFQTKISNLNEKKQKCLIEVRINENQRNEQLKLKDQMNKDIKNKELLLQQLTFQKRQAEQQEVQIKEKLKLKQEFEQINQDLIECYDITQKNSQISSYQEIVKKISELEENISSKSTQIDLLIRENGWRAMIKLNGSKLERDISISRCEESIKQKIQAIKTQMAKDQAQIKILNDQKEELKNQLSINKAIKYDPFELENVKRQLREVKENKIKYIFNQTEFIDQYITSSKQSGKCLLCLKPTDQSCFELLKHRVQQNLPKTKSKINEFELQINSLKAEKEKIKQGIQNNQHLEKIRQLDSQIAEIQATQRDSVNNDSLLQLEKNLQDITVLRQLLGNEEETQKEQLLIQKIQMEKENSFLKGSLKLTNNPHNQSQLQKAKMDIQNKLKQYEGLQENYENPKQLQDSMLRIQTELNQLRLQNQKIVIQDFDDKSYEITQIESQLNQLELEHKLQYDQYMESILNKKQLLNNLEAIQPQFEQKILKKQDLMNKSKNNYKYADYIQKVQLEIQNETDKMKQLELDIHQKQQKLKQYQELQDYIQKLQKWQDLDQAEEKLNEQIEILQQEIQKLQDEYQSQQLNISKKDKFRLEYDLRRSKLEQSFQSALELKKDINRRYDGSEQKRLELLCEYVATQQFISDLKKYLQILEATMLECHGQKMKEINKYLFDTWQKIYNGQDIKFIEVKFDEIPNQKKISKKYNYRLVMRTMNNTEIDMKGRCSMGQKMLASIVFRMALAECFGSNCCFLALDEPTSNLDRKHIKTLAEQLNSLIELMKQHEQQIQLIIITHDMDLVKLLKRHSESYYMISKKENGFSGIEERKIEELK